MRRDLPLREIHDAAGAVWTEVWGMSVPESMGEEPADEYEFATSRVGLADESWRGVLDLRGEEAASVLERTTPVAAASLDVGSGCRGCLLSAKGRLVAVFRAHRLAPHEFRLVLDGPALPSLVETIRKYAFLSEVDVLDRTDETVVLALRGYRATELLAGIADDASLPGEPLRATPFRVGEQEVTLLRGEAPFPGGFEVWVPADGAARVWEQLAAAVADFGGGPVGWSATESLRLEAGVARYGAEWEEDSFPAEVGLEGVLVYDRCYVGQEVVSRMRTYGEARWRLVRLVIPGADPAPVGARLLAGDDEAGEVTSSVFAFGRGGPVALARLRRRYADVDRVEVELAPGGDRREAGVETLDGSGGAGEVSSPPS